MLSTERTTKRLASILSVGIFVPLLSALTPSIALGFGVGTVFGQVTNYHTGEGIPDATLTFLSAGNPITLNVFPDGNYVVDLLAGSGYTVRITAPDYRPLEVRNFDVSADGFHRLERSLRPRNEWTITRAVPRLITLKQGSREAITVTLYGSGLNHIDKAPATYGNLRVDLQPAVGSAQRKITLRLIHDDGLLGKPLVRLQSHNGSGELLLENFVPFRFRFLKKPELTAPEPISKPKPTITPPKVMDTERRKLSPRTLRRPR